MSDINRAASIIGEARHRAGLTQRQLARRAATSQSAVARLERGQASPTLVTLRRLAAAAGFDLRITLVPRTPLEPVIEAYKRDIDRTLLRENLRKSVDERLRALEALQRFDRELSRAMRARRSGS